MALGRREKKIVVVSKVAIFTNAFLSLLKIGIGLFAGSLAVVADGIDSASDVLTSLITLFTAHIVARPPDLKYPYGYNKADTMATKVLAFIIFFAGAQLAISTFGKLIHPEPRAIPKTIAVYIVIVSIIGKQMLALYLKKAGKSEQSNMLIANAKNMQSDVLISFSVLIGLAATFIFKMPLLDALTAFVVSAWIMMIALKIFMESGRDLMDGVDNPEIYKKVIAACTKVEGVFHPHRIRVRKMAHLYIITLDIELPGELTLQEAHVKSHEVEKRIREDVENIYDVLIHIEPQGDAADNEVFGISESNL
ncbi:Cobalt-zinc-cadmium resistance protein [hydrothermal vent metagenome]|uniref:Cobalt-zinc-cadmium resistance protein n=1 Tax=hydrothermal vent metagenome TaxID=652676 RepID=A0A3B0UIM0_9ZZZZ